MTRHRLMLVFLIYLSVDLSNPFVPGAFNFDLNECVDGIQRTSSPHQRTDASALATRTPVVRLELPPPSPVRPLAGGRHVVLAWFVDLREDTRAAGEPPPPGEDH